MKYIAHYKIYSDYENPKENIKKTIQIEFEADSIDELNGLLEEEDEFEDWNDNDIINFEAESELICTTKEFIKVTDNKGKKIKL